MANEECPDCKKESDAKMGRCFVHWFISFAILMGMGVLVLIVYNGLTYEPPAPQITYTITKLSNPIIIIWVIIALFLWLTKW